MDGLIDRLHSIDFECSSADSVYNFLPQHKVSKVGSGNNYALALQISGPAQIEET
jgi:hypothetical protein